MIYVSSACVKENSIKNSIEKLIKFDFKNIELSGGTSYYDALTEDLVNLKKKHDLNYLIHNYFPPPKENFVINLASTNDKISHQSLELCKQAIDMCKYFNIAKYSVHAGFRLDINSEEVGKKIKKKIFNNKENSIKNFKKNWEILKKIAGEEVELYLENNVLSKLNYETQQDNPFFLTDFQSYQELKNEFDFKLLLDIGHLKVSCNSLSHNFKEEYKKLIDHSDFIQLSNNNALSDSNLDIKKDSDVFELLKNTINLGKKTISLEIYNGLENVRKTKKLLESII
jgi:sugar phosphate isomerase/epimerase